MHPFPHRYAIDATATVNGDIILSGDGLPPLKTDAPVEFDGPGDRWSPETLLVAAVADCFVLTFRGIARMSKLPWTSLVCEAAGTLDRVDHMTQFTEVVLRGRLEVPSETNVEQACRLLEKAERTCLVTNSLKAVARLQVDVEVLAHAI